MRQRNMWEFQKYQTEETEVFAEVKNVKAKFRRVKGEILPMCFLRIGLL